METLHDIYRTGECLAPFASEGPSGREVLSLFKAVQLTESEDLPEGCDGALSEVDRSYEGGLWHCV